MAKRSARIQALREKSELSCMSGLFSILDSHQGCDSPKLISNGKPANKLIIDYSRKLDQRISFDEECRKIQYETDSATGQRSLRDLIREDTHIRKHKSKQIMVKGMQWTETDSELVDHLVETQKAARKKSQKAYQSSLCHLNNSASLIHQKPLTKLAIAATIGTVCTEDHREEVRLSQGFRRRIRLGKHDQFDEKNMQQAKMSAKAFVDQMFADRKFICKQRTKTESKPFSDALEVLNTDKDLFMELLPEPNSVLEMCIKNLHPSQTDAKFSKCESKDACCSEKPGFTLATHKGNMNNQFLKKIDYRFEYSCKTSLTAQQSDKIVILKAEPQNRKSSGKFACHCSSRQSHERLSNRVSSGKLTSFSVREIKEKLKHTFGGTRKEPNQFPICATSSKVSHNRSIFGDDCIYRGVETRNPLSSSTNAKTEKKIGKKQGLKLEREPDIAWETDTVRKKIDFSSVRFSKKHGVDVALEAKRHLSARLKDSNAIANPTSERSPKTLGRIISSLEHDYWPLSPRRDSQYCSDSAQMRFSPYSTSHTPNERQTTCLSPLRTNTEVTPCEDYKEYDDTTEILSTGTSSSLISSTDEEAQDTILSANGNMKSNDEPKIIETNNILHSKAPNDINSTTQRTAKIELVHPTLDSFSENETFTYTVDDIPSTPTSIYKLDIAANIKYQEEHQSPVSVLDQFFAEDANSPSAIALQTTGDALKPRRLHFEECLFESSPQDPPISGNASIDEQDYISHCVHLVFKASSLDWDQLSKIRPLSEELLHSSLFDEVEFQLSDSHFNTRLLFDHMNEVLLEIQGSHFFSPAPVKPRICSVTLEELVLDEIMREADFYLLPRTQTRTLDQVVAKDVADPRLWLDVHPETEHIMIHISEDILEESILDVIFEFHS